MKNFPNGKNRRLLIMITFDKKYEITEEKIKKLVPVFRQYIAFWREYPDLFLDFI